MFRPGAARVVVRLVVEHARLDPRVVRGHRRSPVGREHFYLEPLVNRTEQQLPLIEDDAAKRRGKREFPLLRTGDAHGNVVAVDELTVIDNQESQIDEIVPHATDARGVLCPRARE